MAMDTTKSKYLYPYDQVDLTFSNFTPKDPDIDEILNEGYKLMEIPIEKILNGDRVLEDDEHDLRISVWKGDKVLDKLTEYVTKNLYIQLENGNITKSEYANMYVQLISNAMQIGCTMFQNPLDITLKLLQAKLQIEQNRLQVWQIQTQMGLEIDKWAKQWDIQANTWEEDKAIKRLQQQKFISETQLLDRQLIGFDDNLYLKMFESQLSAFGMIFSSGMVDDPQTGPLTVSNLLKSYNDVIDRASRTKSYKVEKRAIEPKSDIPL